MVFCMEHNMGRGEDRSGSHIIISVEGETVRYISPRMIVWKGKVYFGADKCTMTQELFLKADIELEDERGYTTWDAYEQQDLWSRSFEVTEGLSYKTSELVFYHQHIELCSKQRVVDIVPYGIYAGFLRKHIETLLPPSEVQDEQFDALQHELRAILMSMGSYAMYYPPNLRYALETLYVPIDGKRVRLAFSPPQWFDDRYLTSSDEFKEIAPWAPAMNEAEIEAEREQIWADYPSSWSSTGSYNGLSTEDE